MKTKTAAMIGLAAVLAYGWFSFGSDTSTMIEETMDYVKAGDEKMEKELYQEAVLYYQKALEMDHTKNIQDKMLQAQEKFVDTGESKGAYGTYVSMLTDAKDSFVKETKYWEKLMQTYMEADDLENALEVYRDSQDKITPTEYMHDAYKQIRSSYSLSSNHYELYKESDRGYISAGYENNWILIAESGESVADTEYMKLGNIGENDYFLYETFEGKTGFRDTAGIKRGIVNGNYDEFGTYSEGYCPVRMGESWGYIDLDGTILIDGLKKAGCFQGGYAAVETSDGKWGLLDKSGKITNLDVDEIRVDSRGKFYSDEVVIVKKGDDYCFYDTSFSSKNDFKCKDIAEHSYAMAYMDDKGKWGYVSPDGEILIEPKYEQAKSFHNGYAAVCKDGKWGYINQSQEEIVPCRFFDCGSVYSSGTAMVSDQSGLYCMMKFDYPEELGFEKGASDASMF